LFAKNPTENFDLSCWLVASAVDRRAIRHDVFPKRSGLLRKAPDQRCFKLEVLTIGSNDIDLGYTVLKDRHDAVVVSLRDAKRCG
jgi:hypothetical protein